MMKSVGILGGMGPASSGHFFDEFITAMNMNGVVQDEDFPEIVHYSIPLPDWNETGFKIKSKIGNDRLKDALTKCILSLETLGVDIIAIPCNTIHYFYDEMQICTSVPILNIIEETKKYIEQQGFNKIALYSSRSTRDLCLYDSIGILKTSDEEQDIVDDVILQVMSGNVDIKHTFKKLIEDKIAKDGIDAVILGCTELPILIDSNDVGVNIINTTKILVDKLTQEVLT